MTLQKVDPASDNPPGGPLTKKKKPEVAVISSTFDTASAISRHLSDIFSDLASFALFTCTENACVDIPLHFDLALVTSPHIYDRAVRGIPPGMKTIIAARMANIETIHVLYDLPDGADVLVVNNEETTTMQAIDQLEAVGITHLTFHPYYPGIPAYRQNCPYAISFDETNLIPANAYEKTINLGSRLVDFITILELAAQIGVYDRIKSILLALYAKPFIGMSKNIYTQLKTNQNLKEKLNFILNMFETGVLAVTVDSELDFFNENAAKILKIRNGSSPHLREIVRRCRSEKKFFTSIGESNYYVEANKYKNKFFTDSIIVIDGTKKIESIEKDYRIFSLQKGFVAEYTFDRIFSSSPSMKKVLQQAALFAESDSNILVEGESGSGKEMLVQAIHNQSGRRQYPFVAINFAALSESLCESELFGHEEGAFTGARKGGKKGLFELAHNGTIFLDEIGDAPVAIQKKILRVLQERLVMPVGSSQLIPVNVRVIAATNQNLWEMIQKKKFRQDLYYRLKVLPLYIPPLRERKSDIIPTFFYFLEHIFAVRGEKLREIKKSGALQALLMAHDWPGNVRELRNAAEFLSNNIVFETDWITDLSAMLRNAAPTSQHTLAELEQHAPPSELARVLQALNRPPYVFGRYALEETLAPMTHSTIKKYLAILKKAGLIQSRTGYGSYLLDAGKRLYSHFDEE